MVPGPMYPPTVKILSRFRTERSELIPITGFMFVPLALFRRFRPSAARPWFNERAVLLLDQIINSHSKILEIGAGGSTLWYAARGGSVLSLEGSREWFLRVSESTSSCSNVHLELVEDHNIVSFVSSLEDNYDVIVIDALLPEARVAVTSAAKEKFPNSVIVVDDQDWIGHREIDQIMSDWSCIRVAGIKSFPFNSYETNFFAKIPLAHQGVKIPWSVRLGTRKTGV